MSDRRNIETEDTDDTNELQTIDLDELLKFNASDVKGTHVQGHRKGRAKRPSIPLNLFQLGNTFPNTEDTPRHRPLAFASPNPNKVQANAKNPKTTQRH